MTCASAHARRGSWSRSSGCSEGMHWTVPPGGARCWPICWRVSYPNGVLCRFFITSSPKTDTRFLRRASDLPKYFNGVVHMLRRDVAVSHHPDACRAADGHLNVVPTQAAVHTSWTVSLPGGGLHQETPGLRNAITCQIVQPALAPVRPSRSGERIPSGSSQKPSPGATVHP